MMKAEQGPDLFKQINSPKDPNNMTDLEKKHTPRIECPDSVEANKPFDVTVNIGIGLNSPSELAHFIEWISLETGRWEHRDVPRIHSAQILASPCNVQSRAG